MFGSFYLQLLVGELISYLRYLCLLAYCGIQRILSCFLFVFLRLVASFSGLTIVDCSFGILQRLFVTFKIPFYPLYHNLSAASTTNTTLLYIYNLTGGSLRSY
jgi:hypothetical protein